MNIENLAKGKEENLKKYEYFKGLGYGEKAAQLLAVLDYGETFMCRFLRDFDKEARLDKLYAWLLERPEKTPAEAFRNVMGPKAPEMVEGFGAPAGSGGPGGFFKAMAAIPQAFAGAVNNSAQALRGGVMESRGMAAPMMAMKCAAPAPEKGITADASGEYFDDEECLVEECLVEPELQGMTLGELAENLATDSYELIEEKDAKSVLTAPTSTFRMTTTTASMGILLNQIRFGRGVDLSQVRIEEVLNYFGFEHGDFEDKNAKFRISTERFQKSDKKELLYINVEASDQAKEHQNIIILLDVSGSMGSQRDVTLETLATIVSKLSEGDVLSLVTYSSNDATIFADHVIAGQGDKEDVMGQILGIEITGCTYGSKGIETAYELGKKVYRQDWSNQVILITDGDLNFGITEKGGLKELIEEKKKGGMFLSVIGTGLFNYQDDKLEVLSKHGNGTYCVVNDLEDVKYSINQRYVSLTNAVAKDVKAQVEFNPKFVKKYRLLGYENRALSHEDFKNDKVISEPYGAGGHGVAVYELLMGDATASQELKYQQAVATDSSELCTVKVRFKEPLGEESTEISKAVQAGKIAGEEAVSSAEAKNARFAYFLYCLSEKLRKSDKLDEADEAYYEKVLADGEYKEMADDRLADLELLLRRVKKA